MDMIQAALDSHLYDQSSLDYQKYREFMKQASRTIGYLETLDMTRDEATKQVFGFLKTRVIK